jgi:hypothetical protein
LAFQVKEPLGRPTVMASEGKGKLAMTLYDVLLIAGASWLVLIVVTGVVNNVRRRIEDQRRLASRNWEVR